MFVDIFVCVSNMRGFVFDFVFDIIEVCEFLVWDMVKFSLFGVLCSMW